MKRLASRQHPENHREDPAGGGEVCTEGDGSIGQQDWFRRGVAGRGDSTFRMLQAMRAVIFATIFCAALAGENLLVHGLWVWKSASNLDAPR